MTITNRPTALVTGGNSGIGFECARELARNGWHVLIASRDRARSAGAVSQIVSESGQGAAEELGLDLGSTASVRAFVKSLIDHDIRPAALVCNAGLQLTTGSQRSADGFELTFAVNHLGHFLLVNLLLDHLLAHPPVRILVVASGVHDPAMRTGMPHPRLDTIETLATASDREKGADGRLAYVNSKLCNLWFTYELDRRLALHATSTGERAITVNAFDPGLVPGSGLARDYPAPLRAVWNRVLPLVAHAISPIMPTINPAWKSGQALARLVTSAELTGVSGKYFPSHSRWREAPSSTASYDTDRAHTLWEASSRMTGLAGPEPSAAAG